MLVLVLEELKLKPSAALILTARDNFFMQFASWRDHHLINIGLLIGDYIHDNFFCFIYQLSRKRRHWKKL